MTIRCAQCTSKLTAAVVLLAIATPVTAELPAYIEIQEITQAEIPGLQTNTSGIDMYEGRMAIGAGTEFNDYGVRTGAAYTYDLADGLWVQTQRIVPSDYISIFPEQDHFGRSVAIRGDWLSVGAPNDGQGSPPWISGAVYTYLENNGLWAEEQKLTPTVGGSNTHFGRDIAIDGDTMVVAVPGYINEAKIRFYQRIQGQWIFDQEVQLPEPYNYGIAMIDVDGDVLVASSRKVPSDTVERVVNIFRRVGGVWVYEQTLQAPDATAADSFSRIALSGHRVVVGAPGYSIGYNQNIGIAYVYEYTNGQWTLSERINNPYGSYVSFGGGVEIAGDRLAIGVSGLHTVDIYDFDGQSWSRTQVLGLGWHRYSPGLKILMHSEYLVVMKWDSVVIFEYDNEPPIGDAGDDQTVQAIYSDGSADVTLDGTGSTDPNGDTLSYTWSEGFVTLTTGATASVTLPQGVHTITLTVDDGKATATDEVVITVQATIEGIRALVDGLVSTEPMSDKTVNKLYRELSKAMENQYDGKQSKVLENLDEFIRIIKQAHRKNEISANGASKLIGSAQATQDAIVNG